MSKLHKKFSASTLLALIILLLIAVTVAGYFWNAKRESRRTLAPPAVNSPAPDRETAATEIQGRIYYLAIVNQQQRLKPISYQIPGFLPAEESLVILLNPAPPEGYESPLPLGTTLRRASITDGLATADFSRELVDNFSGGSDNEGVAVFAIVDTLCSLPGVKRVQILVEGKVIDSIGGHLDISSPLSYDGELVVAGG
jgi:hypothetical protein